MRASILLVVIAIATACTNDYGTFRFPKNQTAAATTDAGDAVDAGFGADGAASDR